jgi:hypothetical protein
LAAIASRGDDSHPDEGEYESADAVLVALEPSAALLEFVIFARRQSPAEPY